LGHNQMNYGTYQCDFLGQEKLILGHHKMNYGTKQGHFFGITEDDISIFRKVIIWKILR
jgi:hypothetical protein